MEGDLCVGHHLFPAITLYLKQQSWKCLHIRNWQCTEFTSQIFGVVSPLGENLSFLSPLGFNIQRHSNHKPHKIKLFSVRTLKRYFNKKNLIHGRETITFQISVHLFLKRTLVMACIMAQFGKRSHYITLRLPNSCRQRSRNLGNSQMVSFSYFQMALLSMFKHVSKVFAQNLKILISFQILAVQYKDYSKCTIVPQLSKCLKFQAVRGGLN